MSRSAASPLHVLLLAAATAGLAGCATSNELGDLRREQRQQARRLADTRADLESLRVSVNRLQGRLDDMTGGRSSRSSMPPPDVEARLRALEESTAVPRETAPPADAAAPGGPPDMLQPGTPGSAAVPAAGTPAAAAPGPLAAVPPPPVSDDVPRSVDIQKDAARGGSDQYRDGLQAYQRGDYPKAVQSLRGFVTKEPKNDLVPTAQYWIGESYFAQRRYNEAILSYNEILVGWPKSERVPAALLRQAAAFAELGDKIDARLILQKLIADHPGTEEAVSAKRKLLTLGS